MLIYEFLLQILFFRNNFNNFIHSMAEISANNLDEIIKGKRYKEMKAYIK